MTALVYLLFFLSGAAGLVYEVAWARSLGLVFGGSHLAVTTVLVVFMGGLALGSLVIGKRADATARPLRLYGFLELGVAALGVTFLLLMRVYPHLYVPLARVAEENRAYLTVVRVLLASLAMLGPTTLMGGTLPVLTRFVSRHRERVGRSLSFLYGLNTWGGVFGTFACGFLLLQTVGATASQLIAIAVNVAVGTTALLLSRRMEAARELVADGETAPTVEPQPQGPRSEPAPLGATAIRLVLWGTGIAGFCALGYEVLWTRMLGLVVGTSVYSFTIILVAFLGGIAAGSWILGLVHRRVVLRGARGVVAYGAIVAAIGAAALAATIVMRHLPMHAGRLQTLLLGARSADFAATQWASFFVASAYMFLPACLMGAAFPLAAGIVAAEEHATGRGIGEALGFNTIGSILGAAVTGFVLIETFGIERSLQLLSVLEIGFGLLVAASVARFSGARWAIAAATAALLVARGASVDAARFWDAKFFAVYTNNAREAFDTSEGVKKTLELFEVLYFFEGMNETISVVLTKQPVQSFVVNGRTEASTYPEDVQVQLPLGHFPMLLHPDPKKVFVLGTGAGMTLGATTVHPGVERIVLAEIEPGVLPATRTFGEWNHHVMQEPLDPRLHVVFNDGRNYLMTTAEKFDVITADPIHPWSGGAAYLYTREYFRSAADHLLPGGIACQWLPLYELSVQDVKSIVRTFGEAFRNVYLFVTYWDAVLLGSNSPVVLDEAALERRIAVPEIAEDLRKIDMASADALLSYFLAGPAAAARFAQGGVVNTDDNLWLEFSAPESAGRGELTGMNVAELAKFREPVLPYLVPTMDEMGRLEQANRWRRRHEAGRAYDQAHVFALWVQMGALPFIQANRFLAREHPDYAPYQFLPKVTGRYSVGALSILHSARFGVVNESGAPRDLTIAAVLVQNPSSGPTVVFMDRERKAVFARRPLKSPPEYVPAAAHQLARSVLDALETQHGELRAEARRRGREAPSEADLVARLRSAVAGAAEGPR